MCLPAVWRRSTNLHRVAIWNASIAGGFGDCAEPVSDYAVLANDDSAGVLDQIYCSAGQGGTVAQGGTVVNCM